MEYFSDEAVDPDEPYRKSWLRLELSLRVIEHKRTDNMLPESEQLYRLLVEGAKDYAIFMLDPQGYIVSWNHGAERIKGYRSEEISGKHFSLFYPPEDVQSRKPNHALKVAATEGRFEDEGWRIRKDGSRFWASGVITRLEDAQGRIIGFSQITRDLSERRQAEERINHLSNHDALTNLPNRTLFYDRLGQALPRLRWHNRLAAVLFIDLDRFKVINDTMGHSVGDLLLKAVAERMTACVRGGDTVARLGGDEFTIILADVAREEDVDKVAQKILNTLSTPLNLKGRELFTTASIGISIYPKDGEDPETLLKNADTAMYRAKEQGRNNYQFYASTMSAQASERLELESSLHHALERGDFLLHYQPQVDLKTGQIIGMEALVRWQRPNFGLVSPAEFIPLAEETGLILPIGELVLRSACAQNKAWQAAGFPPIRVAVNLSARQFQQQNLIEMVGRVLKETGLAPNYLELELTESTIMKNVETTIGMLLELNRMGIEISIDDFGTGYSSLSYLKRFPINTLKIDKSFTNDMTMHEDGTVMVLSIINLAHNLGRKVMAEGVETKEQLESLRSLGCDAMQGFLFSRPLPATEATKLLAENRRL